MKIQNISCNYNYSENAKNQNNMRKKYSPSFQQLKFTEPSAWEADLMDKIVNNAEINKLVKYLEGRNSVLELHIFRSKDAKSNKLYNISCTYDRHKNPDGESANIISLDKKENIISKLKKFSSAKFIEMIEAKETTAKNKFVELEQDFFTKEEQVEESLEKGGTVLRNFFQHVSNFFKH